MQSRKIYRALSRTNRSLQEQSNIDLNSKFRRLYSKIDTVGDAIILLPDITQKAFVGSNHFGMSFIVDACNDFMTEYNERIVSNPSALIPDLGSLQVVKKALDYKDLSGQRRSIIANYISSHYMDLHGKKVENFDDFIKVFMRWASEGAANDPITNSGIILSHSTPHSVNGLVVQFGDFSENDDHLRGQIVADSSFNIYSNMAAEYGFYVTRNSPWSLIANIQSPIMQRYIDNYVIDSYSDLSQFFGDFYVKAHRIDLREFRSFMLAAYNGFVHFNPILKKKEICSDGSLRVINHPRQKTTLQKLDEEYGIGWWLERLYDLRCFETRMPKKTDSQKQRIYEHIETKYQTEGVRSALDFIAEAIKNG